MIDITLQNFQAELIEASHAQPVLLDIWAPWCAPCKALGPVLEKLETTYGGRFKLAKLNSDEVPQLAGQLSQMFGVRSIPFCVLFAQGQPVDGFVGALPESEIRQFLDTHVPSEAAVAAEEDLQAARQLMSEEAPDAQAEQTALDKLRQAVERQPDQHDARAQWVQALIERGLLSEAAQALAQAPAQIVPHARLAALKLWLSACEAAPALPGHAELEARLQANKRDFEARFQRAQRHFAQRQHTQAMDELLEILMRDKAWNGELARKAYVAVLELMTPLAPPKPAEPSAARVPGSPDAAPKLEIAGRAVTPASDPVVDSYRRKLSMVLF